MTSVLIKLLWGLFEKVAVPYVFQKTAAAILKSIVKSTKTEVDDTLLKPAIDVLET